MLPSASLRSLLLSGLRAAPLPPPCTVRGFTVSAELCSTLPPSRHNRAPRPTSPARPRPQSTLALPDTHEDYVKQSSPPSPPNPAAPRQVVRRVPKVPSLVSPDPYSNEHLPKLNVDKFRNTSSSALSIYSYQRKIKTKKISKYLELLSPIPEEGTYSQVQRKKNKEHRPLTLLYPWLMAEKKHVDKYCRLYTDLGIDVLKVTIKPMDLLRPVPRAQVAAKEVLEYLLDNPEWNKLLIHGMSVGAYGFMEVMTKMEANEDRYLCIRPRFIGQVWDSPCDLPGLKEGVARSISNSRAAQEKIMAALDWFLRVRYQAATRHYVKTQDMYHKNYCNSSSLFLYSRADPVSVPHINTDLANNWHEYGFEVFSKLFNESQHVGHYPKYKAEYTAHIHAYMERIGMLRYAGINLED